MDMPKHMDLQWQVSGAAKQALASDIYSKGVVNCHISRQVGWPVSDKYIGVIRDEGPAFFKCPASIQHECTAVKAGSPGGAPEFDAFDLDTVVLQVVSCWQEFRDQFRVIL